MINSISKRMCLTLALIGAMIGCRGNQGIRGVDNCADIPKGAIPVEAGTYVAQWQQAQVDQASLDRGVLYQADFIGKTDSLGPAAKMNLARMITEGTIQTVPLVIEPSNDSQLDMSRAASVAATLSASGWPVSPDQIQIAYPVALGLDGFRAQQVAGNTTGNGNQGGGGGNGNFGGGNTGGNFGGGNLSQGGFQ